MDPELRDKVLAIYTEVDREIAAAGPVCLASGRCCRFQEYGHMLYLSNLEAAVLLEEGSPPGGAFTPDACPYQKGRLCTARERRPLGCRVYYCDPSYQETGNAISERYIQKLKELAAEQAFSWRYAPLHAFLASPPKSELTRAANILSSSEAG